MNKKGIALFGKTKASFLVNHDTSHFTIRSLSSTLDPSINHPRHPMVGFNAHVLSTYTF